MEWISTANRMPIIGIPVLADFGQKYPIRACWIEKFSEEVSDFNGDADCCEKGDTCY